MSTNFEDIRTILNRIDGVNAPVQEGHYPHIKSFDKLYGINDMQQYKAMADDAQSMDMGEFMDTYSSVIDMAGDFWEDHQKTSESNEGAVNEDPNTLAKELASEIMRYVRKGFDHIPADALKAKAKEYLSSIKESAVQEAPKQKAMSVDKIYDMVQNLEHVIQQHPDFEDYDKSIIMASLGQLKDDIAAGDLKETSIEEDISDKGRIALEKAGFDPMKVKEYMAVFNDHGDTSDIDQMNMDKVGLADAMSMVLASHDVENESYQPFPEGDEFNIEEDEDFEEVLGPLGFPEDELWEAEYRGRKVPLNKPMRGDVKKFKVYVKDPKSGNVKKVNFGHGGTSAKRKTMRIRKSNPKARKSFRARHNCANPGPKTKARYWSCRKW